MWRKIVVYGVAVAIFLGLAALAHYGIWLGVNFLLGDAIFATDRVASASGLVMQIDSFLAAGYIVAIFQVQGDMARRIQEGTRVRATLGESVKEDDLPSLLRRKGGIRYFATRRFPIAVLPLLLFVLSGILAIDGVLYATRYYLTLSISLLVEGSILMIVRWYGSWAQSEALAEFIGKNSPAL